MYLKSGKSVPDLNLSEKNLVIDSFMSNCLQKYWDRATNDGKNPDICTLAEAKEVVNVYILEAGYNESYLRK